MYKTDRTTKTKVYKVLRKSCLRNQSQPSNITDYKG